MALGGGIYSKQNKELPGSYFNFKSEQGDKVTFSERGAVAVPMVLDWQPEGLIHMQNTDTFAFGDAVPQWTRDCAKVFGHPATHPAMVQIRELFKNAREIYVYPVGTATKAANTFGTARCGGVRGNDIAIVIDAAVETGKFDVTTLVDTERVDVQTVKTAAELVANDYVDWKSAATLAKTAATPMTGGTNATPTGTHYQEALDVFESLRFNVLACPVNDTATAHLFAAWSKRANETLGVWHQLVLAQQDGFDSEYVITVANSAGGKLAKSAADLVYYVAGEVAGCAVQSVTDHREYKGELAIISAAKDQAALTEAMRAGKYIYHMVDGKWRVLADNNSLTTYTADKGKEFARNQTIRVLQQRAIDSTRIFDNEFRGKAGTAQSDFDLYKMRLIDHAKYLQRLGAIKNFDAADITVTQGEEFDAYHVAERIQPNFAPRKIYHEITVVSSATTKEV